jgi:hypothetical protein
MWKSNAVMSINFVCNKIFSLFLTLFTSHSEVEFGITLLCVYIYSYSSDPNMNII